MSARTPLTSDEKLRAEANFVPLVAEHLTTSGRFRVSADTPELVEMFQNVAHSVGELLGRPVASYANGRYMVITFAEPTELTSAVAPPLDR
ncbi:hypothetical protein [Herbidospora sp. NBRC 101105]|uniref:hypothetical protein n=1 Tax=Herbidospora sp. NBRC 101105 TaxID=3032195 RepID=UPI0024A602AE|nr:hypothetical protein [Herbidospora sp. NBRC 101105]GLX92233.1 hypothetical protein Hesp01_01830 [Herbidospora sp. NBRC 101105]